MLSKSVISCVINGKSYLLPIGLTLLQACEHVGIIVPRFCYHDRLTIAGNCRMCLVQLDKSLKPVASCALEISPGMKVYTSTALVKKAREGVMEFLLANHPLDCPICDQGGECDLQDQSLLFGNDRGRFYETKRSVLDKDWGHLIKTVMTRCIHCTRCQRFSTELSGSSEIAMVGRGNKSEITNFLNNIVTSEVSGNVIDLCPVGALTSKPYAFTARPWELLRVDHIDTTDCMGSNISLHLLGQRVFRVLPVLNSSLNEEWLSDRARFFYDGIRLQRLLRASMHDRGNSLSFDHGPAFLSSFFYIGPFFSFFSSVGESSVEAAHNKAKLETFSNTSIVYEDNRDAFRFNASFYEFSKADVCVLVGVTLKKDLPLLLVRLRFEQARRPLLVLSFGSNNLGLLALNIGSTQSSFIAFVEGRHSLSRFLKKGTKVHFLLSSSVQSNPFYRLLTSLTKLNLSFSVSSLAAASSNISSVKELGAFSPPYVTLTSSSLFLINCEKVNYSINEHNTNFYLSSFGTFFPLTAKRNYFFPISFYIEENAHYLSGQGVLQLGRRALVNGRVFPLFLVFSFFLSFFSANFTSVENYLAFGRNTLLRSTATVFPACECYRVFNTSYFTPYFSSYNTTPVTYASALLSRSHMRERSCLTFSFPE